MSTERHILSAPDLASTPNNLKKIHYPGRGWSG